MRDIGGNKMGENVTETKLRVANPAALGLMGLGVVTLVACSQKLGLTEGYEGLLPWVFFLGAFAQIIASGIEFKRDNVFCATAFGAYGLFWFAIGMTWYNGTPNIEQMGFAILGYLIFNTYMMYGAAALNKGLFAVFLFIELLLATLLLNIYFDITPVFAGLSELGVALSSFYVSAAVLLESVAGFEVLPLGKPLLTLKKIEL